MTMMLLNKRLTKNNTNNASNKKNKKEVLNMPKIHVRQAVHTASSPNGRQTVHVQPKQTNNLNRSRPTRPHIVQNTDTNIALIDKPIIMYFMCLIIAVIAIVELVTARSMNFDYATLADHGGIVKGLYLTSVLRLFTAQFWSLGVLQAIFNIFGLIIITRRDYNRQTLKTIMLVNLIYFVFGALFDFAGPFASMACGIGYIGALKMLKYFKLHVKQDLVEGIALLLIGLICNLNWQTILVILVCSVVHVALEKLERS